MKNKFCLICTVLLCSFSTIQAAVGDTTWVQGFHGQFSQYGAFDTAVTFPGAALTYRKIYMIITIGEYNCVAGSQYCHQWDYDVESYVMTPGGDTLELSRFITPYATSGTPGFTSTWQQHYIFDVTDYYAILQGAATIREFYSGYSWGFTGDVKFAFIEGTPERNVVGHSRLWNGNYTYGDLTNVIDSNVKPYTLTPPAGTQSAGLKFAITGHGYDNTSGCCEFDNTGVGHTYDVLVNNHTIASYNMNINCGVSELYPQGGTWLYARAGNWCPGGSLTVAQYNLTGVTAGTPYTVDVNFDDSYNGVSSYGDYKIASSVFYYGGYNKTVDASLEDVIAPTNFEWYRRENPRASAPVVKVRNTGGTAISSILIVYGVQDSAMSSYIWTGSLAPSADTVISLPAITALTNLSLNNASGNFRFKAYIQQVNSQTDNDPSNDTITSQFTVAPTYPYTFIVQMKTSSIGANGNFGSNPADASWQIADHNGRIVASRTNANVATTYTDTVTLNASDFYTLTATTLQCYGLNWWALAGQSGYTAGSLKVLDYNNGNTELTLNGSNPANGTYHDDFGCGFVQYFTTVGQCVAEIPTISAQGNTMTASPGASYQWYKNGIKIGGATSQTYAGTTYGNYTVEVIDASGCTATSLSYPLFAAGISELSQWSANMTIYPNPTGTSFDISVNAELTGTTYTIADMMGRVIQSGRINSLSTTVSVSEVPTGLYLITISDGASAVTKRLSIQH